MKLPRTKVWLALAGLLLGLPVALIGWSRQSGSWEQRIAGYRAAGLPTTLAELDAWYAPVPDSENAATALLEAASAWRSTGNTNLPGTVKGSSYPKRGATWTSGMVAAVGEELASNAASLTQAYAALRRPGSRYPVDLKAGIDKNFMTHLMLAREVGHHLSLEARWAAETGDPERAANAVLALLGVARTLEDEPLILAYMIRDHINGEALQTAERVLARTSLPDARLLQLQGAFIAAEATNHLGRAFAGERCFAFDALNQPFNGVFDWGDDRVPPALLRFGDRFYAASGLKRHDLTLTLQRLDELAEGAARPRSEMLAQRRQFIAHIDRLRTWRGVLSPQSRQFLPMDANALPTELRMVAILRSAQAAMAIERWRLAHAGALPGSLEVLVPEYLPAMPEDPLDGKPLRYRIRTPGYVVYSVGEDGLDDGGREAYVPGSHRIKGWDYTFTVAR